MNVEVGSRQKVALKEEGDALYDLHETLCIKCGQARQFKFKTVFSKGKSTTEHTEENIRNGKELI